MRIEITMPPKGSQNAVIFISLRSARVGMQTHFNLPSFYTENCATSAAFDQALAAGMKALYAEDGTHGTNRAVTEAIEAQFVGPFTTVGAVPEALAIERAFKTALLCEVMFGTVSQHAASQVLAGYTLAFPS